MTATHLSALIAAAFSALIATPAWAEDEAPAHEAGSDAELARQLANPVSSLISLPFQFNYDCCHEPGDSGRWLLNVQPVVPLNLSEDWNLIIRTIVPMIYDEGTEQTGFGDTTQSFFFSPSHPQNGLTWAIGPALYYPTGTDGLSAAQWGAGPTALVLKQQGRVTYGFLANHIWSFAGDEDSADLSTTFIQPFFNYTFPDSTGILINSESTYDWEHDQWTVPINVGLSHMYQVGDQRLQLALVGRAYLEAPDNGPDWGVRFVTTFLFPR
jgi:hypothetical protein